jgi:hypothetical protein
MKPQLNKTYSLEELTEMGLRELGKITFGGCPIFFKGDYRVDRERYLFQVQQGDNGQQPIYKLTCEYTI